MKVDVLLHLVLSGFTVAVSAASADFVNFETAPVHPIALSPDGRTLAVCNLPGGRVELFDVTSGIPTMTGSVAVGIDPVALRFRGTNELWVVNFISSSVNVIDIPAKRVLATLQTFTGPSDVVFAGTPERAYVSCSRSNVVMVFDPVGRGVVTSIPIDGEMPRAMAVSPDGSKIYVAIFESGNRSTIAALASPQFLRPGPDPDDPPEMTSSILQLPYGPYGGVTPTPNVGTNLVPALYRQPFVMNDTPTFYDTHLPESIIVKKSVAGRWMDDNNGDWTEFISGTNATLTGRVPGWDLPDHDLAIIDTSTDRVTYATGLMNICMNLAVNPASGAVTVIGTDATNERRFEPNVRGTFIRVNLALVNPATFGKTIVDLNPHLDYSTSSVPQSVRDLSIGDPRGIVWSSNGKRGYVTGMGSRNLVVIDDAGRRLQGQPVELPEGPTGLVLDEARQRLYVWNRFSSSLSVLDTATLNVATNIVLWDPTPSAIKIGRKHLYDTRRNSGLGQAACASCHVDARFDRLAWDLSDPSADTLLENTGVAASYFHPLKGPLVTQTLQDIIGPPATPLHWRGDRKNIQAFAKTFADLLGGDAPLATNEMQEFKSLLTTVAFPPNRFRNFDNSVPANLPLPGLFGVHETPLPAGVPARGDLTTTLAANCTTCHNRPSGFGIGADELNTGRGSLDIHKAAQLRSLSDKLGFSLSSSNSRAGFGLRFDGRADTLTRFFTSIFGVTNDQEIADSAAFMLTRFPDELPASVGRQVTLSTPGPNPLVNEMLVLAAVRTNRVELIAHGVKDGLNRAWWYERALGRFQSDRNQEDLAADALLALAAQGQELTFSMVAEGTGRRLALDRDRDGTFDRTEIDLGFDPADPSSNSGNSPPQFLPLTNAVAVHPGMTVSIPFTATDSNQPTQALQYRLTRDTPSGASLDPMNGSFTWTPTAGQAGKTWLIGVEATDNGVPPLYGRAIVEVSVVELRVTVLGLNPEQAVASIVFNSVPGQRYRLQYKNRLDDPAWVEGQSKVTERFQEGLLDFNYTNSLMRFYRVVAVPP